MRRSITTVWCSAVLAAFLSLYTTSALFRAQAIQLQEASNPSELATYYLLSQSDPETGNYFSGPPMPFNPYVSAPNPSPNPPMVCTFDPASGIYLVMDSAEDYAALQEQNQPNSSALSARAMTMDTMDLPPPDGGDGGTNGGWAQSDWTPMSFGSNDLWLSVVQITNSTLPVTLHGMQSGEVYGLLSKTNLGDPSWTIEHSFPTIANQNWSPTSIFTEGRTAKLFLRAQDWSGTANGMPISWMYDNFGMIVSADYDPDGDGIGAYDDWQWGIEPNRIAFTVSVTNQNVSSSSPVYFAVSGGIPYSVAFLVDDTNFNDAVWHNFDSNAPVTLNVGATDGWHSVWVGLRGRVETSEPTWEWMRVKLDRTPPVLVFTNPPSQIVTQPTIQLQGYCLEQLTSLRYDITNAAGLLTNQQIVILDQVFSTNTLELTTNFFQAFDVHLAVGSNVLTVRAMDLAGNQTSTNLTFVLDYTQKTNPPLVQLTWPLNGTTIGNSNFLCHGWVNDPTASVVATVVSTNATNTVSGTVGYNGTFTLRNVPLSPGTNQLNLTFTDAAGNSYSTNIIVVQSAVQIGINSIIVNHTGTPPGGSISSPDYAVWVNGIQGTNYGNGWSASVPLTLDTAFIHVSALPGGSGSPVEADAEVTWPDGDVYCSKNYCDYIDYFGNGSTWERSFNWSEGSGGTFNDNGNITTYPGGRWPLWDLPGNYPPPLDNVFNEMGYFNGVDSRTDPTYGDTPTCIANTQYKIITGGTPSSTGNALYRITATARQVDPTKFWWGASAWPLVPVDSIQIGSYGKLNQNGVLYAVLPVHKEVDISQHVNGAPLSNIPPPSSGAGMVPHIFMNGQDISGGTATVIVGQQISLTCAWPSGMPSDLPPITNFQWKIPGYAISNFVADVNHSIVYSNFPTMNSNVVFYWVDGGTKEVTCTNTGQQLSAKAVFNVVRPNVQLAVTVGQIRADTNYNYKVPGTYLHFGGDRSGTTVNPGIKFELLGTDVEVFTSFIQTGNVQENDTGTDGANYVGIGSGVDNGNDTNDFNYPLDGAYPNSLVADDSPATSLSNTTTNVSRSDSFTMFIMVQATNSGAIMIPVKKVNWSWSANAVLTNSPLNQWKLTSAVPPANPTPVDTTFHPTWTNHMIPIQWTPHSPP